MRHRSFGLLALALLPLSGCCSLARLFCGPDHSKWVSVSRDTPTHTVETFFEAIRRDAPDVIWGCFAKGFRERHKLDSMTFQVAWQRLLEQNPGLHVVGYAEVPPPTQRTAQNAMFEIDVEGTRIRLDLVCESFWELTYRRDNGTLGGGLDSIASWSAVARIAPIEGSDPARSRLVIEPLVFEHEGTATVPIETVERAALVRLWRIADLHVQPAP
jgi:hypothetical protein